MDRVLLDSPEGCPYDPGPWGCEGGFVIGSVILDMGLPIGLFAIESPSDSR